MIPRLSPPFDRQDAITLFRGWWQANGSTDFEERFAKWAGVKYGLAFPYARSGLFTLFKAKNWQGREIILPAYTCEVVASAIVLSGNIPRFVDIDPWDFNMRLDAVAEAISDKTAAIILTHMYGFPLDMEKVEELSRNHPDILMIHDCALALGTTHNGKGVWQHGDIAMFSFSIGKHISTVEGGLFVTRDKELYDTLKAYRDRTFKKSGVVRAVRQSLFFLAAWLGLRPFFYSLVYFLAHRTSFLDFLTQYYDQDRCRLPPNFQETLAPCLAGLGLNQIKKIPAVLRKKQELASLYRNLLQKKTDITLPQTLPGASFSHFPILVANRHRLVIFMQARGIEVGTGVFDYVIPEIAVYREYAGGTYPGASRVAEQLVLLPNYHHLTPQDIEKITTALQEWMNHDENRL